MSPSSFDLETITFAGSLLLAAFLTYSCWSPPNSTPSDTTDALPKDNVGIGASAIQIRRSVTLSLWILHTLLAISYPSPPVYMCPNTKNLSSSLFTWSAYTATALTMIMIAAPIRLLAFKQLGQNFTFRLAVPQRLVTTGLYAYVQHPSYPTNWLILATNIALLLRLDGVLGCVLPSSLVSWAMGNGGVGLWPVLLGFMIMSGIGGIWIRVRDEEAMLKSAFRKE